jgi:hypothetical protein
MQTMQEQPGLCRGCFVVAWAESGSSSIPPEIAKFASASSPSKGSTLSGSCLVGFSFLETVKEVHFSKIFIPIIPSLEIHHENYIIRGNHKFVLTEGVNQFKPELQDGSNFSISSAVNSCGAEQEDLVAGRIRNDIFTKV